MRTEGSIWSRAVEPKSEPLQRREGTEVSPTFNDARPSCACIIQLIFTTLSMGTLQVTSVESSCCL